MFGGLPEYSHAVTADFVTPSQIGFRRGPRARDENLILAFRSTISNRTLKASSLRTRILKGGSGTTGQPVTEVRSGQVSLMVLALDFGRLINLT